MATTTTTTLPRPPRASFNASQPPTSALPALPNSLSGRASTQNLRKASLLPQTPRKVPGPLQRPSTPSLPVLTDAKNLIPRRAVSIAAFPQPPRTGSSRIASLPPTSSLSTCNLAVNDGSKPLSPSPTRSPKRGNNVGLERSSSSPSIKTSKPKTISVGSLGSGFSGGASGTAYLSPPHSRSSSAQGSYSTNATTIDASAGSGDELTVRGRTDERSGDREGKGNVIVSVRVRPDANDSGGGGNSEWIIDGRDGKVGYGGKDGGIYEYDNVFGQNDNNSRVYDSCAKRLVRRVMEGYHGTVFAYGMTGTGKTFSMQGTTSSPGVIPLAITDIFSFIRETPHREFLLRVSYLEIYNERIHDLLATQPGGTGFIPLDQQMKGEEIKLREDAKRGVYATPLKEEIVQSPTQLLRVIARGDLARRTGSTQFNARSSRSHAVVQIVVESRDRIPGTTAGASMAENRRAGITGGVRVSTLSLIDLAGSERAAENKERRTEGAHINRSLLTLGTVIARLSSVDKEGNGKDKDGNHLPYRDSKLTRLLQPALSGGSLVSILCTIALPPSQVSGAANATHIGETMNTLKFAARARNNIVSHAKKVDESLTGGGDAGSRVLLERYRMEITELRAQLDSQKRREGDDMRDREEREEREVERHSEQLLEIQLARTALKERIEHLNRLILSSKSSGVNSTRSSLLHGNNGHMSSLSIRSSTTTTHLARPFSTGSSVSTAINGGGSSEGADDDSTGEFGDGSATLAAQVRALQADVADKNRYIATLEKRLLQARRSSQSRTSIGFSPPRGVPGMFGGGELVEEARVDVLLQEKDEEIAELRARLDDKERMVSALRSAARKRDVAEVGRRSKSSFDEGSGRRRITSGSSGGTTAEAEDGTF